MAGLLTQDAAGLPLSLRANSPDEALRPGERVRVLGERDAFLRELLPSPYPSGVTHGDRLSVMQFEARERYRERRSFVLMGSTSSGKTVAGCAPIFEGGRRAVFCYPYRALLYDQASELLRIASVFGYNQAHFGYLFGGVNGAELARQMRPDAHFLVGTPDKLLSLFLSDRMGVMAASAILSSADFFFDEVHAYTPMMRRSLIYFLRSVRLYRDRLGLREPPVFIFASATMPEDLLQELRQAVDLRESDILTGPSYTGDAEVEILVPRSSRTRGRHPIAEDINERGHTTDAIVVVRDPFDAWMIANAREMSRSALLFVGQDKQAEQERRSHIRMFAENPRKYALVGSSAIEAGVDLGASALYIQESTGSSTAQAFGRGARAGRDAYVVYYGNRLHHLATDGFLRRTYTRAEWNTLLRTINPERPPATMMSGIAASPYLEFWGGDLAKEILDPDDMELAERVRQVSGQGHLGFRGLVPYTSYESGERIGFRSLFRKWLAMEGKRVKGSPDAARYFMTKQRPTVHAHIRRMSDIAHREVITVSRAGRQFEVHYLLACVDFGPFGRHWTVLELVPGVVATGSEFIPDNLALVVCNRPVAGPGMNMHVRFYG